MSWSRIAVVGAGAAFLVGLIGLVVRTGRPPGEPRAPGRQAPSSFPGGLVPAPEPSDRPEESREPAARSRLWIAVTAEGEPVAGLRVEVCPLQGEGKGLVPAGPGQRPGFVCSDPRVATTDENGVASFELDPGTYRWRVAVRAAELVPPPETEELLELPVDRWWSGPLPLSPGEERRISCELSGSTVRGFVFLPDGRPAAGAWLRLAHGVSDGRYDYYPEEQVTTADASGAFFFGNVLPSSPSKHEGEPPLEKLLLIRYKPPGHVWQGRVVFRVDRGQDVDLGSIVLRDAYSVKIDFALMDTAGRRLDPEEVFEQTPTLTCSFGQVSGLRGFSDHVSGYFDTQAGQSLTMHGLNPGSYFITCLVMRNIEENLRRGVRLCSEHGDARFNVPDDREVVVPLVVETRPRDVELLVPVEENTPRRLRVCVVLGGLPAFVQECLGGRFVIQRSSDESPMRVTLHGVPRTRTLFVVSSHDFQSPGETPLYGEVWVDASVDGPVVVPVSRGGTISGRALDSAGRPCAGLSYRFEDERCPTYLHYEVTTDEDGRFELRGIPSAGVLTLNSREIRIGTTDLVLPCRRRR